MVFRNSNIFFKVIYLVTGLMRHASDFSSQCANRYKVTAAVAATMRASMLERGFPSYASNKILLLATIYWTHVIKLLGYQMTKQFI
jgi:hypothetical protein